MKKKTKSWLIVLVVILALVSLVWWVSAKKKTPSYSTVKATSGPLLQTVSETGTVKPVKELNLNFQSAGLIKEVDVKVGDKVKLGQVLARLDDSSLLSRQDEASSSLKIAEANLSKILVGASQEDIAISRSNLKQAQTAESNAQTDLDKTKNTVSENIRQAQDNLNNLNSEAIDTAPEQAVASASTALNNARLTNQKSVDNTRTSVLLALNDKVLNAQVALDNINTILEDDNAKNVLSSKNTVLLSQTKEARLSALALLNTAKAAVSKLDASSGENDINVAGDDVKSLLSLTDQALAYAYSMLEATVTTSSFPPASLDAYKTLISGQATKIDTATSTLESSLQAFHNAILTYNTAIASATDNFDQAKVALSVARTNAENALSSAQVNGDQQIAAASSRLDSAKQAVVVAQAQLNSVLAPARAQDIALARAQVSQAQATLAGIEQQMSDTILKAPLDGVITQVNYEAGEIFSGAGEPMAAMLVNNNFDIEVDITESNISKIKLGDPVDITLDAFPDNFILKGKVAFIDPAQTVIQDVVYYQVKVDFVDIASQEAAMAARSLALKAGMTANVVITTDKREEAVQVPARAIIDNNGSKSIRLLVNDQLKEVPVTTGLRGDEGMTEILSGVKAGDQVITFINSSGK